MMIKQILLLFNLVGLFFYQIFLADGVSVSHNIPTSLAPGSEFTVELTVVKGAVGGFAKLQQELPEGIVSATAVDAKGATFSFANQVAKFIWPSLPSEPEFKISYKIVVAPNASGPRSITGKFSYLTNNEKQTTDIPVANFEIGGNATTPVATTTPPTTQEKPADAPKEEIKEEILPATTEAAVPVDNKTPTSTDLAVTTPTPTSATPLTPITCTRQILNNTGSEFTVEIKMSKGNISGFAKLQETLPVGCTATVVQAGSASFTFAEQKAKFVWVNIPTEPEFTISYKVSVDPSVKGEQKIEGMFSYLENDNSQKYMLAATTFGNNNETAGTTTPTNTPELTTQPEVAEPTAITEKKEVSPAQTAAPKTEETPVAVKETPKPSVTNIPSPQTGVNYKVQIAASHSANKTATLVSRYNLKNKIATETHEGWTKYTVGKFTEYKAARDHREEVIAMGITGSFVTAYNSGKRITVQEALMISNQKWYR